MKELIFNIKYLFCKREFYIATFIILFLNLVHVFLCINESIRANYLFEELYSAEYQFVLYNNFINFDKLVIIVFPVIFSMIFSDSSWMDNNCKITNMLFFRLNYNKNIIIRAILSVFLTFFISFFGFLFNYIVLRIIYGTGNSLTYWQSTAFSLFCDTEWFLDIVRHHNPTLFVLIINLCVSLVLGLLSCFSYLISFFIKNRIVIYFISPVFLILSELIFSKLGIKFLSFIKCLRPFSKYNVENFVICLLILLFLNLILLYLRLIKKDLII